MKTRDILTLTLLALLPLSALFCAGSSETGNAAMVSGTIVRNDQTVASASVRLVADGFIPGTDTSGNVFSAETDAEGGYTFTGIPPGDYYLDAEKDDERVLRGPFTLEAAERDPSGTEVVDTIRQVATITLTIPENQDISVVYIEGTSQWWKVTSGTVTINRVPAGTVVISGLAAAGGSSVPQKATTIDVAPAENFSMQLGNLPPVIESTAAELADTITVLPFSYSVTVSASDPEADALTWTLIEAPENTILKNATGSCTVTWEVPDTVTPGIYRFGMSVEDQQGGARILRWSVTIDTPEAPVITLLGSNPDSVTLGSTEYVEPGYTATDAVDGDLTADVQVSGTINLQSVGEYTLTYTVKNSAGLSDTAIRTVLVVEASASAPVITLAGNNPDTVELGSSAYVEPGYSAFDPVEGDITNDVLVHGEINTSVIGDYRIDYTVSTAAGSDTATRTVLVVEAPASAPVITLLGDNPDTVELGSSAYVEPGYSAVDPVEGDVTSEVLVLGEVTTSVVGDYHIDYTVTTAAGSDTVSRTVRVLESETDTNSTPVIALLGDNPDSVVVGSGDYQEPGYAATDTVDGDITDRVTVSGTIDMNTVGNYSRTYTVVNSSSMTATVQRTIRVLEDPIQ